MNKMKMHIVKNDLLFIMEEWEKSLRACKYDQADKLKDLVLELVKEMEEINHGNNVSN